MPVRLEALRDYVFKKHAFIDAQLILENCFIELVLKKRPIGKGERHEKPGIHHVALEARIRNA